MFLSYQAAALVQEEIRTGFFIHLTVPTIRQRTDPAKEASMQEWFREQMAMYTAYHRDPRNCATHFVGVPLIVFSLLVLMSLVGAGQAGPIPLTLATLFLAGLLILYFIAVPLVGFMAAAVHIPMLWVADAFAKGETSNAWVVIIACFVAGWIIQFIGHIFVGRRPALFDNLIQVFMAPGFFVAEALFAAGLLGSLKSDLQQRSIKYNATAT